MLERASIAIQGAGWKVAGILVYEEMYGLS
jgi:hypothetical protein